MIIQFALLMAMQAQQPDPVLHKRMPQFDASAFQADTQQLSTVEPSYTIRFSIPTEPDNVVLEEVDPQGEPVFKVFRDGHVEAADPSKLDDATKRFWKMFTDALPTFCKQAGGK